MLKTRRLWHEKPPGVSQLIGWNVRPVWCWFSFLALSLAIIFIIIILVRSSLTLLPDPDPAARRLQHHWLISLPKFNVHANKLVTLASTFSPPPPRKAPLNHMPLPATQQSSLKLAAHRCSSPRFISLLPVTTGGEVLLFFFCRKTFSIWCDFFLLFLRFDTFLFFSRIPIE